MVLYSVLMATHVLVSICLIVVVLLQSGKGGGLAGAFGGAGATQTMFGGRGAGDFLTRATQVLGGAFMLASLILVLLGGNLKRGGVSGENQRFINELREQVIGSQPTEASPGAGFPATIPVEPSTGGAPGADVTPGATGQEPATPGVETPPAGEGTTVPDAGGASQGGGD